VGFPDLYCACTDIPKAGIKRVYVLSFSNFLVFLLGFKILGSKVQNRRFKV